MLNKRKIKILNFKIYWKDNEREGIILNFNRRKTAKLTVYTKIKDSNQKEKQNKSQNIPRVNTSYEICIAVLATNLMFGVLWNWHRHLPLPTQSHPTQTESSILLYRGSHSCWQIRNCVPWLIRRKISRSCVLPLRLHLCVSHWTCCLLWCYWLV